MSCGDSPACSSTWLISQVNTFFHWHCSKKNTIIFNISVKIWGGLQWRHSFIFFIFTFIFFEDTVLKRAVGLSHWESSQKHSEKGVVSLSPGFEVTEIKICLALSFLASETQEPWGQILTSIVNMKFSGFRTDQGQQGFGRLYCITAKPALGPPMLQTSEAAWCHLLSPAGTLLVQTCDRPVPAGLQRSRSWKALLQEMARWQQHREGGCWPCREDNELSFKSVGSPILLLAGRRAGLQGSVVLCPSPASAT